MIKAENSGRITENSRNLPENSLKNPKILMGGSGFAGQGGGLPIFSMTGGVLAPLWSCLSIRIRSQL